MTDPNLNPTPEPKPIVGVDPEAHTAILKELENLRNANSDLRTKLDNVQINTHKDKEDWKTVAQIKEQEANDYKSKYTGLQSALINREKLSKVQEAAVKAGINPAALPDLELLDLPEVTVQTTSNGKILVDGADLAINKLMTLRPHWFGTQVASINPANPNTLQANPNTVTLEMLSTAQIQYSKTKSESDKKTYENLVFKYNAQKQAQRG